MEIFFLSDSVNRTLCKVENVYTSAPSRQGCELQSVKITDGLQIILSFLIKPHSNMENIWLMQPLVWMSFDCHLLNDLLRLFCGGFH